MTYQRILELLGGAMCHPCSTAATADITNFVAGDLMSDILTLEDDYFVLLTSLATEQTIRTADFVGARAVVLVNNKRAPAPMLALAKELNISILTTPCRMFRACLELGKELEAEGHRIH